MGRRTHSLALGGALLLLGLLVGMSGPASAASQASTVQVSTSVSPSCTIGTAAIAFAPYDPVNANATVADDQTGDIVIRCTKGTTGITIDLGNGAHNTGQQRRMVDLTSTSTFINYEVYKETGRSSVWGAGDGGTVRTGADLNGTGNVVAVTMYGRIPPAQLSAIAGAYSDTLVSTINF
ncbi:MAG: spore coat U domain-containing protein [Polyangia bacterium]